MVLFLLERVPTSLRGELTRWMLEPKTGVFVGTMSAMVRERLWEKINEKLKDGAALCIHSSNSEQGFTLRSWGRTSRQIEDFEGLFLVKRPTKAK
jgi:CRISPR-associated protein Cas2